MQVEAGATDVTTYFVLRGTSDGIEESGLTITDFDLQYVRTGVAPSAKVDATALAATDSAHADNKAIEIDATDAPGLYRVDWPDAAFASGVSHVILTVKCSGVFTEHMIVEIGAAAVVSAMEDAGTILEWMKDVAEGDSKIEGTDPFTYTIYKKDTDTAKVAKYLYQKDGTAVTSTDDIVAQELESEL